ncbi:NOP protein chaperone 1-like isoform X2 [Peromyscus californicus insignis]|uniref:NOP protein chaperone 1-like isoform X2 n=1 Tax=Peromyscus californicus insignis TaxID=564181 RepID=UPI0022A79FB1|nr:NOP protein chaperone 1-like isoform X2 [Peromyscus californicus insignis]XP_052578331.1 NOP protein chaperone 1-like isoform X2 [Peromyscus californicus insignis]
MDVALLEMNRSDSKEEDSSEESSQDGPEDSSESADEDCVPSEVTIDTIKLLNAEVPVSVPKSSCVASPLTSKEDATPGSSPSSVLRWPEDPAAHSH